MTKVVCTLGPSTEAAGPVNKLVTEGMSVARLNFSHVMDYSEPLAKLELVREAHGTHGKMGWAGAPPNLRAVMVDTKGPEIRTGTLPGGLSELTIEDGSEVVLTYEDVSGDPPPAEGDSSALRLHVDYQDLAATVVEGGSVLLDDGLITLQVQKRDIATKTVWCAALNSGPIKARKGVNLPGATLTLPALTAKDRQDLQWAVGVGADFVAASFIRSAANVRSIVAFLERSCDEVAASGKPRPMRPLVISKIESQEGVDNYSEILEASDGIMVARGDLGVEIPFEKVFAAQKMMIREANAAGKPVIVATQMLDSMMRQPRPTRAEVTDVGAAVMDGADAVMLSGETAAGKYPIQALKAMVSIVKEADAIVDDAEKQSLAERNLRLRLAHEGLTSSHPSNYPGQRSDAEMSAVAAAAVNAAEHLDAKLIIAITETGAVARAIARSRPSVPVVAFCFSPAVARRLQLHRAVHPLLMTAPSSKGDGQGSGDSAVLGLGDNVAGFGEQGGRVRAVSLSMLRQEAARTAKELGWVKAGERVVIVDRNNAKGVGATDAIKSGTNLKVFTVV
eukprot:CAMPEP_0172646756 /NCGR_PEP_ID=MMETSP1068-20121228/240401_1 /TAXON_ID=35684 /ORGANISM="Pseudopedinella elastica, Strain CCMP716" /LENGTH=563 /DNA_ID=CAMNT_0013461021 /DNA_START=98 /DNA_END=1789 /DNA_ORIENTATION=-